jgi:hypothetical protein
LLSAALAATGLVREVLRVYAVGAVALVPGLVPREVAVRAVRVLDVLPQHYVEADVVQRAVVGLLDSGLLVLEQGDEDLVAVAGCLPALRVAAVDGTAAEAPAWRA